MLNKIKINRLVLGMITVCLLPACATVTYPDPADPWEGMNRDIFAFNDELTHHF